MSVFNIQCQRHSLNSAAMTNQCRHVTDSCEWRKGEFGLKAKNGPISKGCYAPLPGPGVATKVHVFNNCFDMTLVSLKITPSSKNTLLHVHVIFRKCGWMEVDGPVFGW